MGVELIIPQEIQTRPVELRRRMVGNPAVMAALNPVERSVFLASTAKTFAEYDDKEMAADILAALRYIFRDVGYRETNDDALQYLLVRLCALLKRHYETLTLRDFKMAFEMTVTGELDDYFPKRPDGTADRGHYQQFNAEYVCKILNAYKRVRSQILAKAVNAIPEPETPRDYKREREELNELRAALIGDFEAYRETGRMPRVSPIAEMLYYDLLAACGLAHPIEVTEETQRAVFARAIAHYAGRGEIGEMERLKREGPGADELKHAATVQARHGALVDAFEKMVANGIDIRKFIIFE